MTLRPWTSNEPLVRLGQTTVKQNPKKRHWPPRADPCLREEPRSTPHLQGARTSLNCFIVREGTAVTSAIKFSFWATSSALEASGRGLGSNTQRQVLKGALRNNRRSVMLGRDVVHAEDAGHIIDDRRPALFRRGCRRQFIDLKVDLNPVGLHEVGGAAVALQDLAAVLPGLVLYDLSDSKHGLSLPVWEVRHRANHFILSAAARRTPL